MSKTHEATAQNTSNHHDADGAPIAMHEAYRHPRLGRVIVVRNDPSRPVVVIQARDPEEHDHEVAATDLRLPRR